MSVLKRAIRKDYPTTGVLKRDLVVDVCLEAGDQEGLPDYWGIETTSS